ncbi:metallophosphoesterase [Stutzerimonas chloritidismutans]|uniref:metallophosphoesterase n=1 Tax=Stutzerimonas chloritidismutans TaxID=203192 RepID=UPI003F14CCFE
MRIHLLSDLHNEFEQFVPQVSDVDVVILAGDIDVRLRGVEWARQAFSAPILYVPGNHEFYGGHLAYTLEKMRLRRDDRVWVMDRDEVIIDGVRFLGATMWTDFSATGNPVLASLTAQNNMNDYRKIRTGNYRRIRPADLVNQATKTRDWLRIKLDEHHDGPTVVITHHAPTMRSLVDSPHAGSHLDAAYANSWEDLMGINQVMLWVHGHSHTAIDYEIAGTRVVCNPRGYPGEKTGFDPALVLEI